jgi:hypothetical protein
VTPDVEGFDAYRADDLTGLDGLLAEIEASGIGTWEQRSEAG